ncbi:MAG: Nucleoside diphosphate kinase [uncultured bacterium]|nr:MAG: Nucleoside diphosphate kinase [uncultured bacterium]
MNTIVLVLLKPDCIVRGLTDVVISGITRSGLRIVYSEDTLLTIEQVESIYSEMVNAPFYHAMVEYLTSSPSKILLVSGENAQGIMQTVKGNDVRGTGVRGEYLRKDPDGNPVDAIQSGGRLYVFKNIIHVSDDGMTEREFFCLKGRKVSDLVRRS